MEPNNNRINEISELKEFEGRIDQYLSAINAPDCAFDPVVHECMNLSHEDFLSLSPNEAQANCYKLTQYSLFLHKELNTNQARLSWCDEIIYRMIAKTYKNFPDFMKFDVRRHSVIMGDTFAYKVDTVRLELVVRVMSLQNLIKDVAGMISIFQKKAYDK